MRRMHLIVKGRVQGIFFRSGTAQQGRLLGLTGWVKNLPDGNVEVVAEGHDDALKELLKWCQHGPLLADVDNVEVKWEDHTGEFKHFSSKY